MEDITHNSVLLRCEYCDSALEGEWEPEFSESGAQYYKTTTCVVSDCGKKNRVKQEFLGSGHDSVVGNQETELESILRKVQEGYK